MSIVIDPDFSIYELLRRANAESPVLRDRATMSRISYTIEDMTRIDGAPNRIFAGFQRFSKVLPQVERYRQIAHRAESVYIFGAPDVDLPVIERVTYVPLKTSDTLSREWFVISTGADFTSALCSVELSQIDDPDHHRHFEGLWTFDAGMVDILQNWLGSAVDAPPMLIP